MKSVGSSSFGKLIENPQCKTGPKTPRPWDDDDEDVYLKLERGRDSMDKF